MDVGSGTYPRAIPGVMFISAFELRVFANTLQDCVNLVFGFPTRNFLVGNIAFTFTGLAVLWYVHASDPPIIASVALHLFNLTTLDFKILRIVLAFGAILNVEF